MTSSGEAASQGHSAQYRSSDLDETRRIVAGIYCEHRLDQTRARDRLDYRHVHARMGDFSFSQMGYGADVRVEPGTLGQFYLVQVPLTGGDRMCLDGVALASDPVHASIHGPGSGLGMNWSADCSKFVVRVEREPLERHAVAMSGRKEKGAVAFRPLVDLREVAIGSWIATAQHVFAELQRNPALAGAPLVRTQFEQMLMTTMLSWLPGGCETQVRQDRRMLLPRHVKAAEDYMRAYADQALTVDTLAHEVGVSGRTLFEGFRKFLGVSPMRYLRDLRMERARHDLLDPAQPRSVTLIATHWGFYQLGRFASDYRRRFGEQPHETMVRGR